MAEAQRAPLLHQAARPEHRKHLPVAETEALAVARRLPCAGEDIFRPSAARRSWMRLEASVIVVHSFVTAEEAFQRM
jgi:hypothetical protein